MLAGQLIEHLTGTPYAYQINRRIVWPLGLRDTVLPGAWPGIPGHHAHGYFAYQHDGELRVVDVATANPSWAGSAGTYQGHTGGMHGYQSFLLSNADGSRRVAMSVTTGVVDPFTDPEAAERLGTAMTKVVTTAIRGTAPARSLALSWI